MLISRCQPYARSPSVSEGGAQPSLTLGLRSRLARRASEGPSLARRANLPHERETRSGGHSAVAALLGPAHPGCPVLVLDEDRAVPSGFNVQVAPTGRRFITEAAEIARYLALVHGAGVAHP